MANSHRSTFLSACGQQKENELSKPMPYERQDDLTAAIGNRTIKKSCGIGRLHHEGAGAQLQNYGVAFAW